MCELCHKCRIHRWILEHKLLFQTIEYGRTGKRVLSGFHYRIQRADRQPTSPSHE